MADVYIMCGIPGSGKSTWIKNHVKKSEEVTAISRDEVRFSLLQPGDDYFSKEKEVTKIFWEEINQSLAKGKHTFVDQTSLTKKSRSWLIQHLTGYDSVNVIWINTSLNKALEHNEARKGIGRTYVPREQIRRMYLQFEAPTLSEGFSNIYQYKNDELVRRESKCFG